MLPHGFSYDGNICGSRGQEEVHLFCAVFPICKFPIKFGKGAEAPKFYRILL